MTCRRGAVTVWGKQGELNEIGIRYYYGERQPGAAGLQVIRTARVRLEYDRDAGRLVFRVFRKQTSVRADAGKRFSLFARSPAQLRGKDDLDGNLVSFRPEHTPDWKRCSGNCYRCCPEETVFARICDSITEAYELYLSRSPGWHILTRHLLEEIVLRGNSRPDLNAVPPQILHAQRLLNDLNFHYEDFEEIAHLTGLSRSVFFRLFREHTGTTPQRYRESRMLRLATALLEASDLTLNEIASRTGFSDPYYFSHRFKAAFHQSPGTYRRSLRVNADSGK